MHNVNYSEYPLNVNRGSVQKEWDAVARREDWQEGATGLPGDIVWMEGRVFDDRDDAEKFIEEYSRERFYAQIAVKFRLPDPKSVWSKRLDEMRSRLDSMYERRVKYAEEHSPVHQKADFIGCKSCGSKINKKFIKFGKCPVCRSSMYSETARKTIARYDESVENLKKEIAEEERRIIKMSKDTRVMWLVKTEYHT